MPADDLVTLGFQSSPGMASAQFLSNTLEGINVFVHGLSLLLRIKMPPRYVEQYSLFQWQTFQEAAVKVGMQFWMANLRDLIAATGLVILLKLDSNRWFFSPCDLEIWWMTSKIIGHLFYITSSFVHHLKPLGEFKLELQSGNAQFGSKSAIFLSRVTLKFDRWAWKTIGHIFCATSSFVHNFVAIGEFKLELQSGNAQFGSKSTIFLATWPWNLTDDLEKQ